MSLFACFRCFVLLPLALLAGAGCDNTTDLTIPDPEATPDGWRLVWADEFEGPSLDEAKWSFQEGDGCPDLCGWGNAELQWYQRENVAVEGGRLVITAREDDERPYTSARIRTRGKGDWTYGRFEIKARLPVGQGIWPAIWLLPTEARYGEWAASGEIDIVETIGSEPGQIFGTIHYGGTFPAHASSSEEFQLAHGTVADDFFVYILEWEEEEIRWYVNNVLYATQTEWETTGGDYPAPFDQPFHLLLNVAVGGNLPGPPDGSTPFPVQMEVDYVRVYERENAGGGS